MFVPPEEIKLNKKQPTLSRAGLSDLVIQKPYYQDDFVTIYNGDSMLLTPFISPVDLIITDPPYGIGITKGYKSGATELVHGDDGFSVIQ